MATDLTEVQNETQVMVDHLREQMGCLSCAHASIGGLRYWCHIHQFDAAQSEGHRIYHDRQCAAWEHDPDTHGLPQTLAELKEVLA